MIWLQRGLIGLCFLALAISAWCFFEVYNLGGFQSLNIKQETLAVTSLMRQKMQAAREKLIWNHADLLAKKADLCAASLFADEALHLERCPEMMFVTMLSTSLFAGFLVICTLGFGTTAGKFSGHLKEHTARHSRGHPWNN